MQSSASRSVARKYNITAIDEQNAHCDHHSGQGAIKSITATNFTTLLYTLFLSLRPDSYYNFVYSEPIHGVESNAYHRRSKVAYVNFKFKVEPLMYGGIQYTYQKLEIHFTFPIKLITSIVKYQFAESKRNIRD